MFIFWKSLCHQIFFKYDEKVPFKRNINDIFFYLYIQKYRNLDLNSDLLSLFYRKDESIKQPNYLNYGDSQPKDLILKKRKLGMNISYLAFI